MAMKRVKKYLTVFKITVVNDLMYSRNFLGQLLFFGLFLFVYSFLWRVVFKGGQIEGFTFVKMMWYFMFTESIMLAKFAFHGEMAQDIKTGDIAYHLNKPYSYLLFMYAKYLSSSLVRMGMNLIFGSLILFVTLHEAPVTPVNLILGVLSAITGLTINFTFYFLIGMSAFWFEENTAFSFIYSKFLFTVGGLFIPVEFFPEWLKQLSDKLPFMYILNAPAKVYIEGIDEFLRVFPIQLMQVGIWAGLIGILFFAGTKKLAINGG